MSNKYISQINSNNFVFPNNKVSEYDIELVHDLNDISVSGTVTSFSATTFNTTGITLSYNITWNKNNADPYINTGGDLNLFSIHMLAPTQNYYKPFRMIHYASTGTTGTTTANVVDSFTVLPSTMGLTGFTSGLYNFEIRFIGKRAVSLVCAQLNLQPPTPTPTPTLTPTPTVTNTPTPTPTVTNTPTPTPTVTNTPTPTPTGCTSLDWSYTISGGATGLFKLWVNGVDVETRSSTSSGIYNLIVGDQIYFTVDTSGCSEPDIKANSYTLANPVAYTILSDATCADNSTSLTTTTYTVVSGDCGTTINVDAFSSCDTACV